MFIVRLAGNHLYGIYFLIPKPCISLLAVPRRLFCFDSFVILDVACCYLWLFSLYINIKIGKNSYYMFY